MSLENRVFFENMLLKELKEITGSQGVTVTASKNKLKFRWNKIVVADIFFQHLAKADAYVLGGFVYGGVIFECSKKYEPPYKSNLFSDSCFSFVTSGRSDKRFSNDIGGAIRTPKPDAAPEVCKQIRDSLESYYVPKVISCIVPSAQTIEGVIESPSDYAYPALFIHCALAFSPGLVGNEKLEQIKTNKKIIKNKDFDLGLLNGL